MTLILELLKSLGIVTSPEIANKLNAAIDIIADPAQRQAELALALAELREGKIPSIVKVVLE
jgi:hypothetical protein